MLEPCRPRCCSRVRTDVLVRVEGIETALHGAIEAAEDAAQTRRLNLTAATISHTEALDAAVEALEQYVLHDSMKPGSEQPSQHCTRRFCATSHFARSGCVGAGLMRTWPIERLLCGAIWASGSQS